MNVFYFKKNSCETSIARASLGPRRGRRRARLIGERRRRHPTPTTTAASHKPPRRPPTKVGTALALVVHRAQSPGGCPRPVDTRTPGRWRRWWWVTRAHRLCAKYTCRAPAAAAPAGGVLSVARFGGGGPPCSVRARRQTTHLHGRRTATDVGPVGAKCRAVFSYCSETAAAE